MPNPETTILYVCKRDACPTPHICQRLERCADLTLTEDEAAFHAKPMIIGLIIGMIGWLLFAWCAGWLT